MKLEELKGSIPRGWIKAFGQMLVDEVNAIDPDVSVFEAKEKYGTLRIGFTKNDSDEPYNYPEGVDRVATKYEILSEHICVSCGKPDVPVVIKGWISPWCSSCYKGNNYAEVISDDNLMADSYVATRFGEDGTTETEYDISDTAEKIRSKWRAEHDERNE